MPEPPPMRFVRQNADGFWGVYREHDVRAFPFLYTRSEAIGRACMALCSKGGGDLVIQDRERKTTHAFSVVLPDA